MRPHVQRHVLVQLVELLAPTRQRVERQPEPPRCPRDAAPELALRLERERERALPEPSEAPRPASAPVPSLVPPERAPPRKPLGRAGPEPVVRVEAEHGREGRDEGAEPGGVGQRLRGCRRRRRERVSRGRFRLLF